MSQVKDFFKALFSISEWPPRWHCGNWTDFHGWLYIVSDLLIWSAYFAIPLIIIKYISKRKEAKFHRIYLLFAGFILACGCTHFLDAVAFWYPAYRLNALMLCITGIISWLTVFYLIKLLPIAFSMKSSAELEAEVEQRKLAEEELRKKNAYLIDAEEIARIGYWEWSNDTKKIFGSEGLFDIICSKRESGELRYEHILEQVYPEDRANVENIIREVIENKQFNDYYCRIKCTDGSIKTTHTKGQVILNDNNEIVKLIGTIQDVTHQKKIENDIIKKSIELRAINAEWQKFFFVASHDLQEPLRKIRIYSSLLEDKITDKGIDTEYIDKIINSSVRMQSLIDNILEFSSFRADNYPFSEVDLNSVVQEAIASVEGTIQETNAKFNVTELPLIEGNYLQLVQLFKNLISNGIKFARKNEVPELSIRAEIINLDMLSKEHIDAVQSEFLLRHKLEASADNLYCRISVTDNGIGFEEIYLDRIFQIFQKLHSKFLYEGTGIGLAICKRITEIHHGFIYANSQPGNGATFIIVLPMIQ